MAEPLSILASITGVLAFSAQLTRQITTLLSEVRDAPIEIQDLKFELQNLSSLIRASHNLLTTHTLLPDDKPLEGTVAECLDRCSSAMSDIKSQLSHFWQAGSGGKSFFRAINWVIRKNEIRNSRDRLRDARAMFELAFTVLHACVPPCPPSLHLYFSHTPAQKSKALVLKLKLKLKLTD